MASLVGPCRVGQCDVCRDPRVREQVETMFFAEGLSFAAIHRRLVVDGAPSPSYDSIRRHVTRHADDQFTDAIREELARRRAEQARSNADHARTVLNFADAVVERAFASLLADDAPPPTLREAVQAGRLAETIRARIGERSRDEHYRTVLAVMLSTMWKTMTYEQLSESRLIFESDPYVARWLDEEEHQGRLPPGFR